MQKQLIIWCVRSRAFPSPLFGCGTAYLDYAEYDGELANFICKIDNWQTSFVRHDLMIIAGAEAYYGQFIPAYS